MQSADKRPEFTTRVARQKGLGHCNDTENTYQDRAKSRALSIAYATAEPEGKGYEEDAKDIGSGISRRCPEGGQVGKDAHREWREAGRKQKRGVFKPLSSFA